MNKYQYNQGIGKFKVLSSTAGVGSIVPTTWSGFIMPLSINNWPMIRSFSDFINAHPNDTIERVAEDSKCVLVSDQRFVEYLRCIQRLPNLTALISVPHINLSEFNYCDYQTHPLFKKWASIHPRQRGEDDNPQGNIQYVRRFLNENGDTLTIPAIVFPRWYRSGSGERRLMPIEKWKERWEADFERFKVQQHRVNHPIKDLFFVQPVECKKSDEEDIYHQKLIIAKKITSKDGRPECYIPEMVPLEQVQMVLICPNGHISDIPWDKYFALKLDAIKTSRRLTGDDYRDLFKVDSNTCNNGQPHKLQWLPNRSNPESYGTLKCTCCGESVSLEGIMNIRPLCRGEKPWVGDPNSDNKARENCDQLMRWALVTSNSVYYAESFNSLYIPEDLLDGQLNDKLKEILEKLIEKHENWQSSDQKGRDFFEGYLFYTIVSDEVEDYNSENDEEDGIDFDQEMLISIVDAFKGLVTDNELNKQHRKIFKRLKKNYDVESSEEAVKIICVKAMDKSNQITSEDTEAVLRVFEQGSQEEMTPEKYRYDEYKVFMEKESYRDREGKYLCFNDVDLSQMDPNISKYFYKIKQFSNLAVSTTQLQFSRASSDDADDEQQGNDTSNQTIFDCRRDDVKALPANQNFGEGLFFSLKDDLVRDFCNHMEEIGWYNGITPGDLGHKLLSQMDDYGRAKFYLLHTFSHIVMKELEFTCGYPTASLQERLYYSDRMCGVLIYTADGSEGSMGGLVAQGAAKTIEKIISKAIERALDCSSDPLCWENTDQLNKAACFSCCMVSETSCEFFNMGLDRRALVDDKFGYFKELV